MVRADLPRGLQAAQIIHAAGESSPGNIPAGTHAVCLCVPNEAGLAELETRLRHAGVQHTTIVESDAPYSGQRTAIGFPPSGKEVLRRFLSSLACLK